jgi:UDP-N-acetylmuramoylalanine--D-glutamate ligase
MRIAILGYSDQGKSAYEYWSAEGNHEITICDSRDDITLPKGVATQLGSEYLTNLDRFDIVVRGAPTIHPKTIVAANSPEILSKVTSNTNEFLRVCPTKNVIGITGTKGKGTTSTLTTKMLEAAGKTVHLGGNIGIPPLDLLKNNIQPTDWVVLELANFQLIDLKYSPCIAVCLMVVPEHLNWHTDMAEYIFSKSQLFEWQTSKDIAIYYAANDISKEVALSGAGQKLPFYASPGAWINGNMVTIDGAEICTTDAIQLLGKHNWQNVCAALTAYWQVDQNIDAAKSAILHFRGLPHRLELVREQLAIRFFNDSFAATPDAAVAAVSAIPGQKVMIFGGFDRKLPLDNFARDIASQAQSIEKAVLIGESAKRTGDALIAAGFTNFVISEAKSIKDIVELATSYATAGCAVVLSPGFASFDMFKNFEDRGLQFKAAVEAL